MAVQAGTKVVDTYQAYVGVVPDVATTDILAVELSVAQIFVFTGCVAIPFVRVTATTLLGLSHEF